MATALKNAVSSSSTSPDGGKVEDGSQTASQSTTAQSVQTSASIKQDGGSSPQDQQMLNQLMQAIVQAQNQGNPVEIAGPDSQEVQALNNAQQPAATSGETSSKEEAARVLLIVSNSFNNTTKDNSKNIVHVLTRGRGGRKMLHRLEGNGRGEFRHCGYQYVDGRHENFMKAFSIFKSMPPEKQQRFMEAVIRWQRNPEERARCFDEFTRDRGEDWQDRGMRRRGTWSEDRDRDRDRDRGRDRGRDDYDLPRRGMGRRRGTWSAGDSPNQIEME